MLRPIHATQELRCPTCKGPCRMNPAPLDMAVESIEETRPFQRLLRQHGSQRRVMEAYWTCRLTAEEETAIEDKISLEQRVMYKPVVL